MQEALFTYPPVLIQPSRRQRLALANICKEIHKRPRGIAPWLWQSLIWGGVYSVEDWALAAITDAVGYPVSEVLREA